MNNAKTVPKSIILQGRPIGQRARTGPELETAIQSLCWRRCEARLANIRLHQTRHTYARLVGELAGSMVETQDALGHRNAPTTRVYLQRVAVKQDKHRRGIAKRVRLAALGGAK